MLINLPISKNAQTLIKNPFAPDCDVKWYIRQNNTKSINKINYNFITYKILKSGDFKVSFFQKYDDIEIFCKYYEEEFTFDVNFFDFPDKIEMPLPETLKINFPAEYWSLKSQKIDLKYLQFYVNSNQRFLIFTPTKAGFTEVELFFQQSDVLDVKIIIAFSIYDKNNVSEIITAPKEDFRNKRFDEIKSDIADNFQDDIAEEFPDDISDKFQDDIADNFQDNIADNFQDDIAEEFPDDISDKFQDNISDNIQDNIADNFQDDIADNFQDNIADNFQDDIAEEFPDDISDKFQDDYTENISNEIEVKSSVVSLEKSNDTYKNKFQDVSILLNSDYIIEVLKNNNNKPELTYPLNQVESIVVGKASSSAPGIADIDLKKILSEKNVRKCSRRQLKIFIDKNRLFVKNIGNYAVKIDGVDFNSGKIKQISIDSEIYIASEIILRFKKG